MTVRLAINGFGRIGRLALRAIHELDRSDVELVAINDRSSLEAKAHMFRFDSAHGRFDGDISTEGGVLDIGRGPITYTNHDLPQDMPWRDANIDVVLECTGKYRARDEVAGHIAAGAKRALIAAPGDNADLTVVYGVNDDQLSASDVVVSNASCTTNCLAPVAKVLHETVGIEQGFMTTVHAYTGDQRLVDSGHKDLRRARAAGVSMIPTSTGAARALALVLPDLAGKVEGTAVRVPTVNVSMVDLCFTPSRTTTVAEINEAMIAAAKGPLKGILDVADYPGVSIDFAHHPASAILDLEQTQIVDGKLARILAWYDNEWGFACRMLDTAVAMAAQG